MNLNLDWGIFEFEFDPFTGCWSFFPRKLLLMVWWPGSDCFCRVRRLFDLNTNAPIGFLAPEEDSFNLWTKLKVGSSWQERASSGWALLACSFYPDHPSTFITKVIATRSSNTTSFLHCLSRKPSTFINNY